MPGLDRPLIPAGRLRALLRLLYPEEITPHAYRLLVQLCDEYEGRSDDDNI